MTSMLILGEFSGCTNWVYLCVGWYHVEYELLENSQNHHIDPNNPLQLTHYTYIHHKPKTFRV